MRIQDSFVAMLLAAMACGPTVSDDDGASSGGSASDGTPTGGTTSRDNGTSPSSDGSANDSLSSTSANDNTGPLTTSTSEGDSTGTPPLGCSEQTPGRCQLAEGCENVVGSDVRPGSGPGEFSCSDLAFAFACAESTCMRFSGILCDANSEDMAWVIEQCIPDGWAPCPDAECTAPGG